MDEFDNMPLTQMLRRMHMAGWTSDKMTTLEITHSTFKMMVGEGRQVILKWNDQTWWVSCATLKGGWTEVESLPEALMRPSLTYDQVDALLQHYD